MFRIRETYDEVTNTVTVDFIGKLPEKYKAQFDNFYTYYEVENLFVDNKQARHKLTPRQDRVCRFCKKAHPEVTFKKTAHLVSSFLGNTFLLSDFECDSCNELFSKYETDFSYFLGLSRSINPYKKGSAIKFKNPDKKLIIEEGFHPTEEKTISTQIKSIGPGKDHFILDQEKKQLVVHGVKHPHTPLKVYLAILKIALSVIPKEYVDFYKESFDLLQTDVSKILKNEIFKCFTYTCPGMPFPSPLVMLFKKKDEKLQMPTHVMKIYFLNYIYQIAIPFNSKDNWMYDGVQKVKFQIAPPLIDENWGNAFGFPSQEILDFSNNTVVRNAPNDVVFSFDRADMFTNKNVEINTTKINEI